jgi:hypothetical protein
MRTKLEILADLNESVQSLYSALVWLPYGTPAHHFVIDAVRHLTAQMEPIEHAILADDSHECGACGEVVENGEEHDDCPAADWNDSSAGQYAANVAKVM